MVEHLNAYTFLMDHMPQHDLYTLHIVLLAKSQTKMPLDAFHAKRDFSTHQREDTAYSARSTHIQMVKAARSTTK